MRKAKAQRAVQTKPMLQVKIASAFLNGVRSQADLSVFVSFARTVARFMQDLRDAEYERRHGDELTGMARALAACIDLTNAIPHQLVDEFTTQAQLSLPLELLRYAISDSKEGRAGAILAPPKAHNRRAKSYFTLIRRAEIIATVDDLVRSGMPVHQAALQVARYLKEKKLGDVTAKQVQTLRGEKSRADAALKEFVARFSADAKLSPAVNPAQRLHQMGYALRLFRTTPKNFWLGESPPVPT